MIRPYRSRRPWSAGSRPYPERFRRRILTLAGDVERGIVVAHPAHLEWEVSTDDDAIYMIGGHTHTHTHIYIYIYIYIYIHTFFTLCIFNIT